MHKSALWGALAILVILALSPVDAREASVTINVSFFYNFNPLNETNSSAPDMTDAIFVGDNPTAIGNGLVTLPLTSNQAVITDIPGLDDVPGLYVARGQDANGAFVEVSSYAFTYLGSSETIAFSFDFHNAHNLVQVNDSIGPFEANGDGICGINYTDPSQSTGNDEITIMEAHVEFCSMTAPHFDRARIYYELDDIYAPEITNMSITPSLPRTFDEGETETFTVNFASNEYPLTAYLALFNEQGTRVDATTNRTLTSQSDLPLHYPLSSDLTPGVYTLYFYAYDSLSNERVMTLGMITIEDTSHSDSSSRRRARTLVSDEDREQDAFPQETQPSRRVLEEEPLSLSEPKKRSINENLIPLVFALMITCVLLVLLIVITLFLKK